MANQVIGSVLVGIGIIFDAVGLYSYISTTEKAKALISKINEKITDASIGDILDAINKFMEYFTKLSTPAQIALLGSFHIAAGIFLLVKKPL